LAWAITCCSDWNGVCFATVNTSWAVATSMIGSKLVIGSNAVVGASVTFTASVCAPKCKV
jgi:hypothetical protein